MTSVAIGGQVLEENETETVLKDRTIRRERRRRFAPPDWRPDAWLLERQSWNAHVIWSSGPAATGTAASP